MSAVNSYGASANVPTEDGWVLADAWVLAAARVCGSVEERGGLFDLVAACDAVNQLIVSREELEHALALLVGADLVVADEYGVGVTASGRELVTVAGRSIVGGQYGKRAGEARMDALFGLLSELPAAPAPIALDPKVYDAACLEYRHTRWTEFRRPQRLR